MMRFFGSYGYRGFGGGMSWFMGIFGLLGAVLLVCLIILIIRALIWGPHCRHMAGRGCLTHGMPGDMTDEDDALRVLRRRFAAGEISKEEYEERLKTLKGN